MRKYYLIAKNTWDEMVSYRVNFSLWRIRAVIGMLIGYFLWTSVMPENGTLFGYSKELMVTYILLAPLVFSIVFSTRTHEMAENINNGDLSLFLIKPFGYFKYWFSRDFGDKAMNIAFCVTEFCLFVLIVRPNIFLQFNLIYLILFLVSLFLAIVLHFFIGTLMSMIGFWSSEVWAPRFIFYTLVSFFAGSLFPLDILPAPIYNFLKFLPFTYLQYYPIKIYLGQLSLVEIFQGFAVTLCWIGTAYFFVQTVWKKGLKIYTAVGR
jgi:ABC-2 type transport system permease protein